MRLIMPDHDDEMGGTMQTEEQLAKAERRDKLIYRIAWCIIYILIVVDAVILYKMCTIV